MKVKAYFGSLKNANKTLERLKSAGFNHSFLDNDNYIGEDPLSTSDPMVSSIGSTNEILMSIIALLLIWMKEIQV